MLSSILQLLFLLAASENTITKPERQFCVTYGDCGGLPCVNGTEALPFQRSVGPEIIKEICPHLQRESAFCCDDQQAEIMKEKLKAADKRLHSCEIARNNFRALICDMTCSPLQGTYVEVETAEENIAKKLKYSISAKYADKLWRSIYRTDHLICGNLFSKCSKEHLFAFFGDNRWTALKIRYIFSDTRSPSSDNVECTETGTDACQEC